MNTFEIWTPVSPYTLLQPFGANPEYYAKFLDAYGHPQKGHMGIDLKASHGTPVYAPCNGEARYIGPDAHGGDGIHIRVPSKDTAGYTIILWHLCSKDDPQFKPLIPTNGNFVPVTCGQLIAYADNTGAPWESSGDHLHLGLFQNDVSGGALNGDNGFGGCIDPAPFMNMKFATDYMVTEKALASAAQILTTLKPTTPIKTKLLSLQRSRTSLPTLQIISGNKGRNAHNPP